MEITKEYLQSEKEKFIKMKEQHLAEANALAGAAQLCDDLISKMDGEEKVPDVKDLFPPKTEFEVMDKHAEPASD